MPELAESAHDPLLGVIEGFYGEPWSMAARYRWAVWLRALRLEGYLYAPKRDQFLRKRWFEEPPGSWLRELRELSAHYRDNGVFWGPGLSPFALYQRYGGGERRMLERRVRALNSLEAPWLAVLFDDMPGSFGDLALRQVEIIRDVLSWTHARRLFVCPTYYSDDPVLDRVFGPRPAGYLDALGELLPPDVEVFWTGREVCARAVSAGDLESVNRALRRRAALWDNHPVNDSRQRCEHLFLGPAPDRDSDLGTTVSAHFANAMNQPTLSLPAVAGLATLHGRHDEGSASATLRGLLGDELHTLLLRDRDRFELRGLGGLTEEERQGLLAEYGRLGGGASEVVAWLSGSFAFDPACLTD